MTKVYKWLKDRLFRLVLQTFRVYNASLVNLFLHKYNNLAFLSLNISYEEDNYTLDINLFCVHKRILADLHPTGKSDRQQQQSRGTCHSGSGETGESDAYESEGWVLTASQLRRQRGGEILYGGLQNQNTRAAQT